MTLATLSPRAVFIPENIAIRIRRMDTADPAFMKRDWTYHMLLNKSGMVIGFSRSNAKVTHYADLRSDRWYVEPILYDDRMILRHLPEGLRLLRGCK